MKLTETKEPVVNNHSTATVNNSIPTTLIPGRIYVKKRCGDIVEFNHHKIMTALKKAFLAHDPNRAKHSEQLQHQLEKYTEQLKQMTEQRHSFGQVVEIEQIQDFVEIILMREGEHQVARSYVLYREQRHQERKLNPAKLQS